MQSKWEENVRRVTPYTPGEQPKDTDVIKLNTNENPYPPCEGVRKAIRDFKSGDLRLYPDTDSTELRDALAERYRVKQDQVFLGVGSDDVLSMAFLTFFASDKPVLFPDITYSFYDVWADVYKIPYKTVPLDDNFRIDPDKFNQPNGGIVFSNPNAPTGVLESIDTVEKIVNLNKDSVIIVDEAYIDFGGVSAVGLVEKYDNLLVVQTFSKSRSLAGARIGFAIGSRRLIKYLNDVKFSVNSYTMNRLTQACGLASVLDEQYFCDTVKKIIKTRERLKDELLSLGFTTTDSKANFVFASHNKLRAKEIYESLKERKIYVRYWDKPRINNYLRITVGTDEQTDKLIEALKKILSERGVLNERS